MAGPYHMTYHGGAGSLGELTWTAFEERATVKL